uniref:Lipoprotein n=1 Tax=Panagrolaimus sp. JU765 TaxID=591449 RepID=A0AC34QC71_9BILA
MKSLLIFAIIVGTSLACNIIVHVKSETDKKFDAQVSAANGQKSSKWSFSKKLQRETFQQSAADCGVGDWHITTFDASGKQVADEKVGLSGLGRVDYEVKDDLKPVQTYRQGAICTGQCAPLGATPKPPSRPNSPTQKTN